MCDRGTKHKAVRAAGVGVVVRKMTGTGEQAFILAPCDRLTEAELFVYACLQLPEM